MEYYKAFADTVVPQLQRVHQEMFAKGCVVVVCSLTNSTAVDPPISDQ